VNLVRAAGGLVVRSQQEGGLEVLVVHRARYADWSFPKGKLDEGESFEEAALREVAEETGLVCRLDGELDCTRYMDTAGRPKIVRYWRMIPVEGDIGDFVLNDEIDALRWVPAEEAETLLTYQHDRDLLAGLATSDPGQSRKS
jgi:8-oxo-dGTP diphosphatase